MAAKFTPEDVVAAYQRLGKKAVKNFMGLNLHDDGKIHVTGERCCALGALGDGLPFEPGVCPADDYSGDIADYVGKEMGVYWLHFACGFDRAPESDCLNISESIRDTDEFKLGRECRKAVEAAGLWHGAR